MSFKSLMIASQQLLDISPDYLPVETILKEDEESILISTSTKGSSIPGANSNGNNQTKNYLEKQLKQNYRMRLKRQNLQYKMRENECQRKKMQRLRRNSNFREIEKLKQRERIQLKRMDPQFREMEKQLQNVRRQKSQPVFGCSINTQEIFKATDTQLNFISRDVNLWLASRLYLKYGKGDLEKSSTPNINTDILDCSVPMSLLNTDITIINPETSNLKPDPLKSKMLTNSHSKISLKNDSNLKNSSQISSISNNGDQQLIKPKALKKPNKLNDKTYVCEICEKCYNNKGNFTRHVKSHFGHFNCPLCDKVFHMKQHLNEHNKVHGEKKFSCDICGYKTCFKYALNRHNVTKHKINKI